MSPEVRACIGDLGSRSITGPEMRGPTLAKAAKLCRLGAWHEQALAVDEEGLRPACEVGAVRTRVVSRWRSRARPGTPDDKGTHWQR